tara:strand:- start:140 stop:451 length:312 start_codon:yes stop_codon:yes gene_type:complete
MRGHNASLASKNVTLPADQSWVKLLDNNPSRMYLVIQNDHDNHSITVGFSNNTTAPTTGLNIAGSNTVGDKAATWEFSVAPINAVWAKVNDAQAHGIEVIYDD